MIDKIVNIIGFVIFCIILIMFGYAVYEVYGLMWVFVYITILICLITYGLRDRNE